MHELEDKSRHSACVKRWWEDYTGFLLRRGGKHKKAPTFGGQEIDLYAFYRAVRRRGGYQAVTDAKEWRDVAAALQVRWVWGWAASGCWREGSPGRPAARLCGCTPLPAVSPTAPAII